MRIANPWITRMLIVAVAFVLCGAPELVAQVASSPQTPANKELDPQGTAVNQDSAAPQAPVQGTTVDPSQGPLTPVPAPQQDELPAAPSATAPQNAPAQPPQAQTTAPPQAKPQQRRTEPVGAGTAEVGPTIGGAASKPAGTAIAPAKQKQTRSLLLKLGALAGAGIAIGTVIGLSKASPSKPPGAR